MYFSGAEECGSVMAVSWGGFGFGRLAGTRPWTPNRRGLAECLSLSLSPWRGWNEMLRKIWDGSIDAAEFREKGGCFCSSPTSLPSFLPFLSPAQEKKKPAVSQITQRRCPSPCMCLRGRRTTLNLFLCVFFFCYLAVNAELFLPRAAFSALSAAWDRSWVRQRKDTPKLDSHFTHSLKSNLN